MPVTHPPAITLEMLRIVGPHSVRSWRIGLSQLAEASEVSCRLVCESSDDIEILVESTRGRIERFGSDILHGALGYLPQYIEVRCPFSISYYRRSRDE
ncbi:hypothetical protein GCM10007350_00010 [Jeongeupia chitinilytica]|uniref:Uncharacterized protein n=1 Tax=Jeongeupia chitinilytica TaxID=1041641 RepID=A0ABQ3GXN6_9NEIS|nr:hypothetical protein GCM10007350_00010 [Jeongeupia chitinilytica]